MPTYFFFTNLKINCKFLSYSFPLIVIYNLHSGREIKKIRGVGAQHSKTLNLIYQ